MKNLVISVSPDSSLELLKSFADILVLDKQPIPINLPRFDTLYIRSHFGQPATLPQNFQSEIDAIVQHSKQKNPSIKFIDGVDTVDKILYFEDKWLQFKLFSDFMPQTQLYESKSSANSFNRPVFKRRLSSRGNGVTWQAKEVTGLAGDWIIQEGVAVNEELRIYVIYGEIYPIGTVRQSMTSEQTTKAVDSRYLTQSEVDFSLKVSDKVKSADFVGLDVARTSNGELFLLEVNRSPGFAAFSKLTGVNLASELYDTVS